MTAASAASAARQRALTPGSKLRSAQEIKATVAVTTNQIGDGGEYLVAGLLTLGGTPTTKMLHNQPGFDLIALPTDGRRPQRVSVKTAKSKSIWISYKPQDRFEWLAIVLVGANGAHRVFVIPRAVADLRQGRSKPTSKWDMGRFCDSKKVPVLYPEFEGNFTLNISGSGNSQHPPVKHDEKQRSSRPQSTRHR